ncbi:MAG: HAMP domain-containing histidine kinase [Micrococcales bacterium]|nr:HAMP domain-containing histidine kinase [Micrococcales bacterium]
MSARLRWWVPVLLLWLVLLATGLGVARALRHDAPPADVATANDIVQTTQARWPAPTRGDYPSHTPDFTVVDADGRVLLAEGAAVGDADRAFRARAATFPVTVDRERVGSVYLIDPYPAAAAKRQRTALTAVLNALAAIGLLATVWLLWLDRRILAPFRELRGFADKVAHGNLDAPLRVHRGDAFGAFSESFDILRTELGRSRERETEARESRKHLVTSLSHDIRTPLATIEATTELLRLGDPDPRLGVIADKARQIEQLTQELFDANADELEQLPVELATVGSEEIAAILREVDDTGWIAECALPEVMVVADRHRLRQVADNILGNARKYGAAPVTVVGSLADELLTLRVRDHGAGVPEAELPLVTRRHYRAANAAGHRGQGLGLHTAAALMERMGGDLAVDNVPGGFEVTLTLACAEREHDPRRHSFGRV